MELPRPLHPGILVKRYKRFLADVMLEDGTEITVLENGDYIGNHKMNLKRKKVKEYLYQLRVPQVLL